jgi:hypothetical protein
MGCSSCGGRPSTMSDIKASSPYAAQVEKREERLRALAARVAEEEAQQQSDE